MLSRAKQGQTEPSCDEANVSHLASQVNPAILGGVILDFNGEKTIDLSAASKVNKLNGLLAGTPLLPSLALPFIWRLRLMHVCACVPII